MACCVAIALMIGLLRRARYKVLPGQPAAVAFPPPARRPGPGQTPAPAAPAPRPIRTQGALAPGPVLAYAAGGAAIYAAVSALLLATGIGTDKADPNVSWLVRDVVVVGLAALALFGAFRLGTDGVTDKLSHALVGMGGAWSALSLLDMHAFNLFDIAHGELAADLAFHGAGSVAIAWGTLRLMLKPREAARPIHV